MRDWNFRNKSFSYWVARSTYIFLSIMPSMSFRGPTPFAETEPHTITDPPPCFTVGRMQDLWYFSCGRRRMYTRRFVPKISNLLSSVKSTFIQSSSVQCLWSLANFNRFLMFAGRKYGFLAATRPLRRYSFNTFRTTVLLMGCFLPKLNSSVKTPMGLESMAHWI